MNYQDFINQKRHDTNFHGFDPVWMPDFLYDFQKHIVEWNIRKGKSAAFADTGLGKTPIQLVFAQNIIEKTNGNCLLLTPLAVSHQTIKEAEKFGIDAKRSRDGKPAGKLTVTNYQQIEKFDPADFNCIVCDECFPYDTPIDVFNVDNSLTCRYIKDISKRDRIFNANGEDYVTKIGKKQINRAIRVSIDGRKITCSENHPFFTMYGWRSAQDLQPGDNIMATRTAMRLVRSDLFTPTHVEQELKILREILLSEMENEYPGTQSKGSQSKSSEKKRDINVKVHEVGRSKSNRTDEENNRTLPHEQSRNKKESFGYVTKNETQTFRAWGKWSQDDITTANNDGCHIRELDSGICYITGEKTTGFSNLLQSRLRESRLKDSNRIRRTYTQVKERQGYKEGQKTGFFRVESVEVLELGHPDLERYRDENGNIYFYDIKAERHPSFSVNGCLVHNSSAIKSSTSQTRKNITRAMAKMKYRFLCTATPSPNDFIELGTSSESLGEMQYMEMLDAFFRDTSNDKNPQWSTPKYELKKHAVKNFWKWVSTWALAVRMPSDLGYNDDKFVLPELIEKEHVLKCTKPLPGFLFVDQAKTLKEQRQERKLTINERCEKVAELCEPHKLSVVWAHYNYETDLLNKMIPNSVNISGSDSDESKEEKFIAFSNGEIKTLITKPKIGAWGLNWQHCNHTVFFPSHSFEQYYQGVRRFHRYGQKNSVTVDIVTTEGEQNVLKNIKRKARDMKAMFSELVKNMNSDYKREERKEFDKELIIPEWIKTDMKEAS